MHPNQHEVQLQIKIGELEQDVYSWPGHIRPHKTSSGVRVSASRAQLQLARHRPVVSDPLLAQVHVR